jgi:hypothetical protein
MYACDIPSIISSSISLLQPKQSFGRANLVKKHLIADTNQAIVDPISVIPQTCALNLIPVQGLGTLVSQMKHHLSVHGPRSMYSVSLLGLLSFSLCSVHIQPYALLIGGNSTFILGYSL